MGKGLEAGLSSRCPRIRKGLEQGAARGSQGQGGLMGHGEGSGVDSGI